MVQQQFNYLHLASVAYKHSLYGKVGTYSSNLFEGALWLNKENGGSVNVIEPQAEIQLESSDPFDPKTTIGKTERVYIQDKRLAYESKRLLESNFGQYTGNVDCLLRVIFDKKPILSPTESIFKKDSDYGRTPLEFRPLVNLEHLDEEETRKLIFFGGGDVLKSNEFFNNNLNLETLMNYYQFGHSHLFAESASIYAFTNFVIPFNEIFKVYNSNNKEVGLLTNDWRMVEHEIKEYISVISESIEISKKMDANDFLKYLNRTNYNEKNNFKINVFSTIKNMSTKEEIEYEIKKHLIHEYLSSNKLIQMSDDLLDRDLFSRINQFMYHIEENYEDPDSFNIRELNGVPYVILGSNYNPESNVAIFPHGYFDDFGLISQELSQQTSDLPHLVKASQKDGIKPGLNFIDLKDGTAVRMAANKYGESFSGVINPDRKLISIVGSNGKVIRTNDEWTQFDYFDLDKMRINI